MNKEIEITSIVKNQKGLENTLKKAGAKLIYQKTLNRDIFENSGNYFIRYSTETQGNTVDKVFTMKSNGDKNSINIIKNKVEIEFPINNIQEKGLKSVFKALEFKKTNSYKKIRKAYRLFNCDLSIDTMDDKTYFEIEFQNEKEMKKVLNLVKQYLE